MRKLERILKALADKNRIRILRLLNERKLCVCELADILGVTQPSVSKHLKKLAAAQLVGWEQDHFWTNYYLRKDNTLARTMLSCLRAWLDKDGLIRADLNRLKKTDRSKLCSCKK